MFLFDILHSENRPLRVVTYVIGAGLFILLAGLWFVQIVYGRHFQENSRAQSLKRVGIPAIRGRILDHHGKVLADNEAHYNAILYLEALQGQFNNEYSQLTNEYARTHPGLVQAHHRLVLKPGVSHELSVQAKCEVVSNITYHVTEALNEPRVLNTNAFLRHYTNYLYVPFDVVPHMDPKQIARFAEQFSGNPDLDIETQPVRNYPGSNLAAHVLGFVRRESMENEQVAYTLPDWEGVTGIEKIYDDDLRGQPGVKLILVNSMNYRQREEIESSNAPGDDVYLTIDAGVQKVAEQALANANAAPRPIRGAVVVLDVRNGDILALASAPSFDPNSYVEGLSKREVTELDNAKLTPQLNRAIDGAYPPGSTFKIITSIACLEQGLNPDEEFDSPGFYQVPNSRREIKDTAGAGKFNFNKAFYKSSNTYFIVYGLQAGFSNILAVAKRFHLGEKTGFVLHPEVAGDIPGPAHAKEAAHRFNSADVCIGQEITTTPLQMAGMIGAIANGGNIYWPRLVTHLRSRDTGQDKLLFAPGRLRDRVQINPKHLELIRHAMLEDTEHPQDPDGGPGTAYAEFHSKGVSKLGDFHVGGKTGTAELKGGGPNSPHRITWFDSYGPFEDPRYAVVVMVEDGAFGGPSCAPVAEKIYEALIAMEKAQLKNNPTGPLARN